MFQQQPHPTHSPLQEKPILNNHDDQNNQGSSCPSIIEEKIINSDGEETIIKYSKGRFLGKGGFAKCYELRYAEPTSLQQKGKIYAVKVVPKSTLQRTKARQKLQSEIKIHKSLSHEFVVQFEKYFEDKENVYILLEICNNQSLNELVRRRKRVTELEAQCYMMQLITATEYLHKHKVIHRDLKLGNLFLNEKMQLKVGDFGLAARVLFDGEKKRTICGTPNYIAPEILDAKLGHSYEVDFWSIGVILYTLICGRPPFESPEVKQTYKKIKACQYSFPENVTISEAAKDFIRQLLKVEPSQRMNLTDMLNHEFMTMNKIPDYLPISTLVCPPSATYVKQYLPQANDLVAKTNHERFEHTAPVTSAVSARIYNMNVGIAPASSRGKDQKDTFAAFATSRDNAKLFNPDTQIDSHRFQSTAVLSGQSPRQAEFQFGKPKLDNFIPQSLTGRSSTTPNKVIETKVVSSVSPNHKLSTTPRSNVLSKQNLNIKDFSTSPINTLNRMSSHRGFSEKENTSSHTPTTPQNHKRYEIPEPIKEEDEKRDSHQQMAKIELTSAAQISVDKLLYMDTTSKGGDLIEKYVDFSSKYGMGYKMSNGAYGVLFNDSTKVILDPNCFHFDYVSRPANSSEDEVQHLDFFNYPKTINKKVILLQHFKSYLDGNNKFKPIEFKFTAENAPKRTLNGSQLPFLKKWKRAKKAILFRLSNKIIQVIFQDQSELILSSGNGMVTFVNSRSQIKKLPLSSDLESKDPSMYKRLQYAKEILIQLINKQEGLGTGSQKYMTCGTGQQEDKFERTYQNPRDTNLAKPLEKTASASHRVTYNCQKTHTLNTFENEVLTRYQDNELLDMKYQNATERMVSKQGVIHGSTGYNTARNNVCQSAGISRKPTFPTSVHNIQGSQNAHLKYQTQANEGAKYLY